MSVTTAPARPGTPQPATGFQQRLGLFDSTMLVAGTMIGSGIFIVSADIARDVGSSGWLLLIWAVTGLMTILGALSYAELAGMMPQAGGQYVFLREAYTPLWGFLYGWSAFLVIQTGSIAAVGVAFAKFLGVLVPFLGTGDPGLFYKHTFAQPLVLTLPLPWLQEPLAVLKRESFTIHRGQLVAVGVVALLTLWNCQGVREGKWVQNVFTVAKTAALLGLIVVGLAVAANAGAIRANWADLWAGATSTDRYKEVSRLMGGSGLLVVLMVAGGAMVGSLFSADAWNNITFTAGEVKDPRRNLPLSIVLGAGLVIVLYLLANVAYLSALPTRTEPALEARITGLERREADLQKAGRVREAEEVQKEKARLIRDSSPPDLGIMRARDDRVATAVLELASPRLGVPLMALAIMVSTFGCINGMVLMGARLYYAMARDGLFFQSVGGLNRRGVPAVGLLLQGAWSVLLIFSGTYNELLDYIMFAALFFYVLTVTGLFVLRRTMPHAERPYRAFGFPVLPALYVLLCAAIMVDLLVVRPLYTWPGLLIVLSGIPVYYFWRLLYRSAPA